MDLDTLSQPSVLQLARDGDFRAIAYWLNTYLVPQNIYARVAVDQPGWLLVMVEFFREPDRDRLNRFICSRLVRLNSDLIRGVRVLGRVMGSADIRWDQSFRLVADPAPYIPHNPHIPQRVVQSRRARQGRSRRPQPLSMGRAPIILSPNALPQQAVSPAMMPQVALSASIASAPRVGRSVRPRRQSVPVAVPLAPGGRPAPGHPAQTVRSRRRLQSSQRSPRRSAPPPVEVTLPRLALPSVRIPNVHIPPIWVELPRLDWPTVTLPLPNWQSWSVATAQTLDAVLDAALDTTVQAFNATVDRVVDTADRISPSQVSRMAMTAAAVFLVGCGVELMTRLDLVSLMTGTPTVTTPTGRVPVLRPAAEGEVPDPATVTLAFSSESPFRVPPLHAAVPNAAVPDAAPAPFRYPDVLLARLDQPVLEEPSADHLSQPPRAGLTMVNVSSDRQGSAADTATASASQLKRTLDSLERQGLRSVGAGRNRREARQPDIVEVRGKRIAYLGYSDSDLLPAQIWQAGTNPALEEQIAEDIDAIRSQVDWVVVNYRWGDELASFPSDRQMRLCRFAIDQGADLVVGYHPAVLQGAEIYKGRAIAYSLGDFIFQPQTPDGSAAAKDNAAKGDYDTAMLKVSLREEQMRLEFLPVQVKQDKPAIAPIGQGQEILRYLEQASALFDQPLKTPMILDRQAPLPAATDAPAADAPAKSFTDAPIDPGDAPSNSFIDYSTDEPAAPTEADGLPERKAPEPAKAISSPTAEPVVAPTEGTPAADAPIAPVAEPVPAADADIDASSPEALPEASADETLNTEPAADSAGDDAWVEH
ncbi:MAG: hypothetical protein Fur0046_17650 [Cyanobacteria bacterium J069]|nr:MAG: hypothetical protein D6742_00990 [Cyanobacteria bacterium J069]